MSRPIPPSAADAPQDGQVRFSLQNWILLGLAAVSVVVGFVLFAAGSIVAAPLLVVLGFALLFPLGIIR